MFVCRPASLIQFCLVLFFACSGSLFAQSVAPPPVSGVANLIRVPLTRQGADYTCGVTAVQSILGYYGVDMRQDTLVQLLKPDAEKGTNYRNIVSFAQSWGFEVSARTNLTLDELRMYIDARIPVLVAIQAWMNPPANWKTNDDGHYVVVVGYDQRNFYFMDPATLGHYTYIPIAEFVERWHDRDSYQDIDLIRFGLIMTKFSAPRHDADLITRMD